MTLSNAFMGSVFGVIGILLYIAAQFLSEEKRAYQSRLLAEALFALMFFYQSAFAGTVYFLMMLASALLQKQIEHNKWVSICYGIAACVLTILFNNRGTAGIVLALSLLLVFLPINEDKMLTTSSYVDLLIALAQLYYTIAVRAWAGTAFSILEMIMAIAGLVSAVHLVRGGGLAAAAKEQRDYLQKKEAQKKQRKAASKAKKIH